MFLPSSIHTFDSPHHYSPSVSSPLSSSPLRSSPSPLSPRNANVQSRSDDTIMSSPTKPPVRRTSKSSTTPSSSKPVLMSPPPTRRETAYSKRTTKINPLIHGRGNADDGRETRRKLFLKKVREGSEDKRWKDRGGDDEIMRCIWVAEERRREERQRREAMGIEGPGEEEEMSLDEVMADEVAKQEERELDALISSLGTESSPQTYRSSVPHQDGCFLQQSSTNQSHQFTLVQNHQSFDTPYGSDDDEYDHIFMDVIEEENRVANPQPIPDYIADQEMMDMS